jgi:1-acyl-sn-glycerol-3-phosphate acyltransferase
MKRSHIDSRHAPQVYADFKDARPNFLARHFLFPAIGLAQGHNISVRFTSDEAEDRIRSYPPNRIGRLLIANHPRESDAFRLTAGFRKAGLKRVLNETITLAKAPLFQDRVRAPFVRAVGAVPVFRLKDEKPHNPNSGSERKIIADRVHAASRTHLTKFCVDKIDHGENVLYFPQGTAESKSKIESGINPLDAVPFKDGVAYLALHKRPIAQRLEVVPMGLAYEADQTELTFGEPFTPVDVVGSYLNNEENRDRFVLAARQRVEACLNYQP